MSKVNVSSVVSRLHMHAHAGSTITRQSYCNATLAPALPPSCTHHHTWLLEYHYSTKYTSTKTLHHYTPTSPIITRGTHLYRTQGGWHLCIVFNLAVVSTAVTVHAEEVVGGIDQTLAQQLSSRLYIRLCAPHFDGTASCSCQMLFAIV